MFKKIFTFCLDLYKNWYSYWSKFLTIIGDIKIYKYPCFLLYNPSEYEYKIHGEDLRILQQLVEPGDILLRSYEHYLDGMLIPGKYSHAGIYIGDNKVIHAIAEGVKEIDIIDFFQCDKACILRPNKNQDIAIERAKKILNSPYDFKFNNNDSSAFYCTELAYYCYSELDIVPTKVTFLGFTLNFLQPRYLTESFLTNSNFKNIIEK